VGEGPSKAGKASKPGKAKSDLLELDDPLALDRKPAASEQAEAPSGIKPVMTLSKVEEGLFRESVRS